MKAALRECALIVLIAAVVTVAVLAYAYAGTHRDGDLYAVLKMVTVFGAVVGFGLLMLRSVDQQSCRGRR